MYGSLSSWSLGPNLHRPSRRAKQCRQSLLSSQLHLERHGRSEPRILMFRLRKNPQVRIDSKQALMKNGNPAKIIRQKHF